jgi:hypothetical protein
MPIHAVGCEIEKIFSASVHSFFPLKNRIGSGKRLKQIVIGMIPTTTKTCQPFRGPVLS